MDERSVYHLSLLSHSCSYAADWSEPLVWSQAHNLNSGKRDADMIGIPCIRLAIKVVHLWRPNAAFSGKWRSYHIAGLLLGLRFRSAVYRRSSVVNRWSSYCTNNENMFSCLKYLDFCSFNAHHVLVIWRFKTSVKKY